MRAFIAIDLPTDVRRALGNLLCELSPVWRRVKWCDSRQIHITLKFFGELPESLLGPVVSAVTSVTEGVGPIPLAVRGVGSFGPGERIRVVWAGVEDPSSDLVRLQHALEDALEPLGFPREGRAVQPHLTIGRLREPSRDPHLSEDLKARSHFDGGSFLADHMILFSSTLTPGGPIYRAIHSWPLEAQR